MEPLALMVIFADMLLMLTEVIQIA
jgi:hypothetical protein